MAFIPKKYAGMDPSIYRAYCNMIQRCENPNVRSYKHYGARGITVCDEWRRSFRAFSNYMGPKPGIRYSLDRYPDNNGNYEPGNVRWATATEQVLNRRYLPSTVFVPHGGTLVSASEFSRITGVPDGTVVGRIKRGLRGDALTRGKFPKSVSPLWPMPEGTQRAQLIKLWRKLGIPNRVIAGLMGITVQRVNQIEHRPLPLPPGRQRKAIEHTVREMARKSGRAA